MARLPDFLKNISPVGETLTAIDGGVAELSQAADAQNARLSVQTADEAGLALWERDYGLSSAGSLAERRARILTALSGGQTVTPAYLRGLCITLADADRGEVAEDFANWTAEVTAVSVNRLPGDLVFLRFSGTAIQHIGLMAENRGAGGLLTIEGNTGAGSDANGGEVQIRVRAMKFTVGGFRPRYEEEQTMVKQQTAVQTVYETLNDVPQTFRGVISALMTAGILQGDGGGKLNLTHEMVRTLTLVYRGGGFDRKLAAAGLESAVKE